MTNEAPARSQSGGNGTDPAPDHATLSYGGRSVDLPVLRGTEDEAAIDIARLRAETGLITMDHGYMNTGCCLSSVTFIDGERGILRYRGYPIEQLAERSSFLEVAYLLIYGDLPTAAELERWVDAINHHTLVHEEMRRFFDSFPYDAHPMAVLASATVGLSTFYQDSHDPFDPAAVDLTIQRLIAKLPTLAAWSFKKAIGQPYVYPRNDLDYASDLLHMMFAVPAEPYEVAPRGRQGARPAPHPPRRPRAELLDGHGPHRRLAATPTSTRRSRRASPRSGARSTAAPTRRSFDILERIVADGGNVQKYVDKAKDPNESFRLAGFGHRVYKNFDPRAKIIKKAADRVLAATGADDQLFEVAQQLGGGRAP